MIQLLRQLLPALLYLLRPCSRRQLLPASLHLLRPRSRRLHFTTAWRVIRSLATDDAYERYLAHHSAAHAATPPMSRRAFYLSEQQRKWTGISRCC
jgi:uncharacterized short protein YbdD (DUF466 family)